jgi:hypothetical protein
VIDPCDSLNNLRTVLTDALRGRAQLHDAYEALDAHSRQQPHGAGEDDIYHRLNDAAGDAEDSAEWLARLLNP